ncbi:MAG: hemerythrin domain-containing protein [Oceanospirillaceae bacterium]|nr:hemerythrin domain-containing protein [Oceanospirillaceae bacterium]
MKRFEALQPLSREHHQALSVAARLARCSDGSALDDCWTRLETEFFPTLRAHFDAEECWLLPLLEAAPDLKRRLLDDHRELRELMASGGSEAHKAFGAALKAHVRFEEQELFEWLQRQFSADALLEAREKGDEAH